MNSYQDDWLFIYINEKLHFKLLINLLLLLLSGDKSQKVNKLIMSRITNITSQSHI